MGWGGMSSLTGSSVRREKARSLRKRDNDPWLPQAILGLIAKYVGQPALRHSKAAATIQGNPPDREACFVAFYSAGATTGILRAPEFAPPSQAPSNDIPRYLT
jgi:hypothetical protein